MKYIIAVIICLTATIANAQPKVIFDYDDTGNRIMRYRVSSLDSDEYLSDKINEVNDVVINDTKDEFLPGEINISPNPTTDIIVVDVVLEEPTACTIILYDGTGGAIRQAKNVYHFKEFDISDLSAGTYYCHIETELKSGIWKIIKAR